MTVGGAVIVMLSLFIGEFAMTGWLAMPPLSGAEASPGVGVDYYIWGLQIAGVGTTLSGIATVVGSLRRRPDVVLASSPPLSVAAVGLLLAARFRAPLVLDVRDLWPQAALALGEVQPGRVVAAAERLERVHAGGPQRGHERAQQPDDGEDGGTDADQLQRQHQVNVGGAGGVVHQL